MGHLTLMGYVPVSELSFAVWGIHLPPEARLRRRAPRRRQQPRARARMARTRREPPLAASSSVEPTSGEKRLPGVHNESADALSGH